jgi:hypothetical protein
VTPHDSACETVSGADGRRVCPKRGLILHVNRFSPGDKDSLAERDEFEPSVPIVQSLDEQSNPAGLSYSLSGYKALIITRTVTTTGLAPPATRKRTREDRRGRPYEPEISPARGSSVPLSPGKFADM